MAGGRWNGTPGRSVATPPLPVARGVARGTVSTVSGP